MNTLTLTLTLVSLLTPYGDTPGELVKKYQRAGYTMLCETIPVPLGNCVTASSFPAFNPIPNLRQCRRWFLSLGMNKTTIFLGLAQHTTTLDIVPVCYSTAKPTPLYRLKLCQLFKHKKCKQWRS